MTNKKILHFDDEPFISMALDKNLKLYGWDVRLVSEVDELFRELKNNQYDAIIMDIMAPLPSLENEHVTFTQEDIDEMDGGTKTGIVLTKRILSTSKYKNTPILFLSARSNPLPENPELNNYKCDYLRKPELAKTISDALKELLTT